MEVDWFDEVEGSGDWGGRGFWRSGDISFPIIHWHIKREQAINRSSIWELGGQDVTMERNFNSLQKIKSNYLHILGGGGGGRSEARDRSLSLSHHKIDRLHHLGPEVKLGSVKMIQTWKYVKDCSSFSLTQIFHLMMMAKRVC